MKTLDNQGKSQDWLVEQGRALQDLLPNDAAPQHAAYWERQHNSPPQALMRSIAKSSL